MLHSNTSWNVFNFRRSLINHLMSAGFQVVVVAPHDDYSERISAMGCTFIPVPMDNHGTHPGRDLLLLLRLIHLIWKQKPAVYLGYTVKANIYGSLAANFCGVPVVNNISGLGYAFIQENWLTRMVRMLYRFALKKSFKVFFQNPDDLQLFIEKSILSTGLPEVLPGSGIDLAFFKYIPLSAEPVKFRFLLIARLLWDKGIGEFSQAAKIVRAQYPGVEFCLLGPLVESSPSGVPLSQINKWVDDGLINYLGATDDVRPFIASADCVVLPSYREGTPRTLLEASAMGRPLITTDVPGCREVVEQGVNGFLSAPMDARSLAKNMTTLLGLSRDQQQAMGIAGRIKMEREYNENLVIEKYLAVVQECLS